MAEALVVQLMRGFKQALLLREAAQMRQMAGRWLEVERAVEAQIGLLAQEMAAERAAGRAVSQAALYRMERYQALLGQMRREIAGYVTWADGGISAAQRQYGRLGIEHAVQALSASYGGVAPYFNILPTTATEHMVGLLGDGTPLTRLLRNAYPEAADAMTRALIKGTALGWNPSRTARAMRDGLAAGLDRTLTIARTEQMRVYREASREQYQASGVVEGYYRIAAHDSTTCMACLAAEGRFYPTEESLDDHPNGRCGTVPKVMGFDAPTWQRGEAWFNSLDPDTQRQMMGRDYYQAWRRGEFRFSELATVRHNATWGDSVQVSPLSELRKSAGTAA